MSLYDEVRAKTKNSSPEEKLNILRSEALHILSTIKGYSQLLIDPEEETGLQGEHLQWCKEIYEAASKLIDGIEGLTDTDEWNRETRLRDREKHEQELQEKLWGDAQGGLTELEMFPSLIEAIVQTAKLLNLTFPDTLLQSAHNHLGLYWLRVPGRYAHVGTQAGTVAGKHKYLGYTLLLNKNPDKRNKVEWEQYQGTTRSLEESCYVLYRWLVEQWSPEVMKQQHPWLTRQPWA